jgi:hypothetical protein
LQSDFELALASRLVGTGLLHLSRVLHGVHWNPSIC